MKSKNRAGEDSAHTNVYVVGVSGELGFPESNYHISPDYALLTVHSAHRFGTVWYVARNNLGATNAKVYLWIRLHMFVKLHVF
uniref:Uncharacterized protein n=1 Tax=Magallana gigas TaxID=29159 RepID=A0A8W8NUL2_MAGGI